MLDNNRTDNEPQFGMPGGSGNYEDAVDENDKHDSISTASRWQQALTELARFDLETNHVDGNEGEDGDDVDANQEEEPLQADDGSTQNVEDWRHHRINLGANNINTYEGKDGDDADPNEE